MTAYETFVALDDFDSVEKHRLRVLQTVCGCWLAAVFLWVLWFEYGISATGFCVWTVGPHYRGIIEARKLLDMESACLI